MSDKCTNPDIGRLLARYEFGKVTPEEKKQLERHLLECEACYKEYYSFLPVTETIKNNMEEFREAAHSREHLITTLKKLISNAVKKCIDSITLLPRPARVLIPACTLAVVVIVYFLSSQGQFNEFNVVVDKSTTTSLVHQPETIPSKAYGDSIAASKSGSDAKEDDLIDTFMKKMFIEKDTERRALIFRWPFVPHLNYYQCYLEVLKDKKTITPVETLTDTLFLYPIESIPKNQTMVWNLNVVYKDGKQYLFTKEFKINY